MFQKGQASLPVGKAADVRQGQAQLSRPLGPYPAPRPYFLQLTSFQAAPVEPNPSETDLGTAVGTARCERQEGGGR